MTILRGPDPYALAEAQLAALPTVGRYDAALCHILHSLIPTYSWVGIYRAAGADLELAAWSGTGKMHASHLRVSDGTRCAEENDVVASGKGGHFVTTARAETAIPFGNSTHAGLLAVASKHRGAFGPADRDFLRHVAAILSERA